LEHHPTESEHFLAKTEHLLPSRSPEGSETEHFDAEGSHKCDEIEQKHDAKELWHDDIEHFTAARKLCVTSSEHFVLVFSHFIDKKEQNKKIWNIFNK
jgi:hypothetical protein